MTTFTELGLNPMILKALAEIGFETPTPIQEKTIPHLINSDQDLIALAQTGTGKTAAFSLPIIQQLDLDDDRVQCLILCPTRELAIQITKDIDNYIRFTSGISVVTVYGGERIDIQIRAMKKRPQIIVGTPGRVNDMIRRRILKVDSIRWLVLDEADEMLNMGFKEELDETLKSMPTEKQVLLFSATMNQPVRRIADHYMRNPEDITVGNKNKGADNVTHLYYVVHEKDRYQALKRIADVNPDIHALVFCRTRHETQHVADKLIKDGYCAEAIHGEVSQDQRTHVMNRFRDKKIQLLVATDVAARGIDVQGLTHVINYNLPDSSEAYLHRSGRTGRAHNTGVSLVIVNMREHYKIKSLERTIGKPFEKGKIPSGDDICAKQLFSLIDKVCNIEVNEKQIATYLNTINEKFIDMSRDELIKKFVSVEFNRFLDHYQGSVDLNSQTSGDDGRGDNKSSILFARFHMNVGRNVGVNLKELLGFLSSQPELKRVEFGNIDIQSDFTLFEIDQRYKDQVVACLSGAEVNGFDVEIKCEASGIRTTRNSGSRGGNNRRRGRAPNRNGGGGRKRH